MEPTIRLAIDDDEILGCFEVIRQLRTHLVEADFLPKVREQMEGGFQLALLESEGRIRAVTGFRVMDNLASRRVLYVDDLVTDAGDRSKGYGRRLFDWLAERGREEGCQTMELDSGVQRFDAHRFYMARGMAISSHHFRLQL